MAETKTVSPIRKQQRGVEVVGHFLVGSGIGKGKFGQVKLGIDTITGEKVAIKTLEKSRFRSISDELRIARELQILREVRHPHIIQLYETYETKTEICLIMEYASHGDLLNHIINQGKLEEKEACRLFQQLVSGLDYLHSKGVTHRDIKPENLLLDTHLNLKIADFGLSNNFTADEMLNTHCGSPCYACPEAISGKPYNGAKADIWSSGVVLYTLNSGQLPFEDSNITLLYQKILTGKFAIPDCFSEELKELIRKMLQVEPENRVSMEEILRSPWFLTYPTSYLTLPTDIDPEIVIKLTLLGLEKETVVSAIEGNKHNQAATAYYLLLMKKVMGSERSGAISSRADLELSLNYRRYRLRNSENTPIKGRKKPNNDLSPLSLSPITHTHPSGHQATPTLPLFPLLRSDLDTGKVTPPRPKFGKSHAFSSRIGQKIREKSPIMQVQRTPPPDIRSGRMRISKDLEQVMTALRRKRSLSRHHLRKLSPKPC